jgi:hypothetical protein
MDLLYILLAAGFIAVTAALALAFDKLRRQK